MSFEISIGDLSSTARGTAARANAGKPRLHLLPLRAIAAAERARSSPGAAVVLDLLGQFQSRERGADALVEALAYLNDWAACARVGEYGAKKYAMWNWAKGCAWSVVLDSAARHALELGGDDAESGLPHVGHVMFNLCMLYVFSATYPEGDDRPAAGLLGVAL